MVQLILGKNGKGKTKYLLDKVNNEVQEVSGNIVYLDKNTEQMYELNNKIRLIDVSEYQMEDSQEFLGFVSGIISQDHDLEQMYFDNFLKIACVKKDADNGIGAIVARLEKISEQFGVRFVLSVSLDVTDIPEELKEKVVVSL